jgi:hypothetical protein
MKYLTSFLLLAAMTTICFARNGHSANIYFAHPITVGSATLHEGNYKMVWDDSKPQVKVSFFRNGKELATADARLNIAENALSSSQPEITFSQHDGASTLDSIEMRHMTLVFSGASTN